MNVVFSKHALAEMENRKIPEEFVLQVLTLKHFVVKHMRVHKTTKWLNINNPV